MNNRTIAFIVLTMFLAAGNLSAQTGFTATLDQSQVTTPTGSAATGTATLTLNAAGDTLTYSITLVGLDLDGAQTPADAADDVTAMHFHNAPPGSNGGVVFGLISPNHDVDDLIIDPVAGTLTGAWENSDVNPLSAQLANLNAGDLYLNVHTQSFGGGEIRGQVIPGSIPSVIPSVSIPTQNWLGFLALALLLCGAGFFTLRRHRAV